MLAVGENIWTKQDIRDPIHCETDHHTAEMGVKIANLHVYLANWQIRGQII